ncbi:MAG: cytochrome P450 family protein [Sciscionella sp.]
MTSVDPAILDERFVQDPHALYARLREEEQPVHRAVLPRGITAWIVTRYADARAALSDPRLSKDSAGMRQVFQQRHTGDSGTPPAFSESLATHMLNTDPPDHTRLRKLVTTAFTSRAVETLRPRVEQITDELLDAIEPGSTVDLLDVLALPLPITVISELLGVPHEDRDDFRTWSNLIVSSGAREDVGAAGAAMAGFLSRLVASKRADPGQDMLSALVAVRDADDRLSEVELVSMAFLLLVAGHDTTVNLIGNGMLALLRDIDQLAALRADSSLLPGAIEEFLRYDGPVNLATLRFTTECVEIGGVRIPRAALVLVSLASANRDPERFVDPDAVDVTRQAGGHLAFGHGIHHCLGAPLARMEAEVAFGRLLARFGDIELAVAAGELRWRESTLMRGLHALPVRLDSAG